MSGAPATTCAIAVMAKAPRAGRSKTRLCPPLSPDEAAALSAAFLRDTTENIHAAARSAPIAAYAAYAPADAEALLAPHLAPGTVPLLADGAGPAPPGVEGFGRCLFQAVAGMLARGHPAACVLSSDTPTLPTSRLVAAAQALLAPGERGLFGACDDGGYYLLGLKRPHARPFADIAWSGDAVAGVTRARAREIGLALVELDPWYDVDDAASLARLEAEVAAGAEASAAGYPAPVTRTALARLGQLRLDRLPHGPPRAGAPA